MKKLIKRNKMKRTWDDILFDTIITAVALMLLVIFIYPLYYLVIASLSDLDAVVNGDVKFWVVGFSTESYQMLLDRKDIWTGYMNSILITVSATLLNLVMTIIGAYVLSCPEFQPRTFIMKMMTFTMYFGGGLIPTFLLIQNLGMYNTLWALIIPNAINVHNLIIARTFIANSIPYELREAAFLDGCGHIRLLWSIILPLSKAIIAVLALYYGVSHWNSYFSALVYLRDDALAPLQLILRRILLSAQTAESTGADIATIIKQIYMAEQLKYSSVIVASVPALIAYPFVQKHLVKGVMIGSVKG